MSYNFIPSSIPPVADGLQLNEVSLKVWKQFSIDRDLPLVEAFIAQYFKTPLLRSLEIKNASRRSFANPLSPGKLIGAMVFMLGQQAEPCVRCRRGTAPFTTCISIKGRPCSTCEFKSQSCSLAQGFMAATGTIVPAEHSIAPTISSNSAFAGDDARAFSSSIPVLASTPVPSSIVPSSNPPADNIGPPVLKAVSLDKGKTWLRHPSDHVAEDCPMRNIQEQPACCDFEASNPCERCRKIVLFQAVKTHDEDMATAWDDVEDYLETEEGWAQRLQEQAELEDPFQDVPAPGKSTIGVATSTVSATTDIRSGAQIRDSPVTAGKVKPLEGSSNTLITAPSTSANSPIKRAAETDIHEHATGRTPKTPRLRTAAAGTPRQRNSAPRDIVITNTPLPPPVAWEGIMTQTLPSFRTTGQLSRPRRALPETWRIPPPVFLPSQSENAVNTPVIDFMRNEENPGAVPLAALSGNIPRIAHPTPPPAYSIVPAPAPGPMMRASRWSATGDFGAPFLLEDGVAALAALGTALKGLLQTIQRYNLPSIQKGNLSAQASRAVQNFANFEAELLEAGRSFAGDMNRHHCEGCNVKTFNDPALQEHIGRLRRRATGR